MSDTTTDLPDAASTARQNVESHPRHPSARTGLATRAGLSIIRGIPTLIVLVALAGLAWWGHHHGWSLPKFSQLTGNVEETGVPWCDEHGVPQSDCISCKADLMPKGDLVGWCEEHGVHECVLHNPQLSQLKEIPDINQSDLDRAAQAIEVRPRTKNDSFCKMHLRRIQFPSIQAVDQAGIDINLVDRGPVVETIKTTGEIVYDPTRVAHLASRANGTILRVEKRVGDSVKKGDVLALIDAVEVGRLKSKLLVALTQLELDTKTLERVERLGGTVIAVKEIQESQAAKAATEFELESTIQALSNLGLVIPVDEIFGQSASVVRAKLSNLGIAKSTLDEMDPSRASANLVPVIASRDGVVVKRDAVAGEVIEAGKSLFTIVDISQMWLQLNVRLEEAERISLGQKILFVSDGSEKERVGEITWISTEVDGQTRTVQIRGELDNESGQLRNETFGEGRIVLREVKDAILVPNEAIHWEGCCNVAFVRDKDYFKDGSYKVFHTRSVRPGAIMGANTEVIAGLLPGEVVVTQGSGILRAELLKGNLGAG